MSQPLLSRERFLSSKGLRTVEESIPEMPNDDGTPGTIRIRQMSARESLELADKMEDKQTAKDGIYWVLVYSCVDENNQRLFTGDDIEALRDLNFAVLNRLQMRALELNNMGKKQEAVIKNDSGEVAAVASPSSLPASPAASTSTN